MLSNYTLVKTKNDRAINRLVSYKTLSDYILNKELNQHNFDSGGRLICPSPRSFYDFDVSLDSCIIIIKGNEDFYDIFLKRFDFAKQERFNPILKEMLYSNEVFSWLGEYDYKETICFINKAKNIQLDIEEKDIY